MALRMDEHTICNFGPYRTLPGVWWLQLTDKKFILITPFFGVELYDGALDFNTMILQRGWRFSWGRAPLIEGQKLFIHERERLEHRWVNR
jgi:hypothetical protein